MIIFCGGTAPNLRTLCYDLCQALLTHNGKINLQGTACKTATEIDAYLKIIGEPTIPTLIQYQIISESAVEKINQSQAKSIYLHQDPRQILAAAIQTPTKKETFESTFIHLWQEYQEKWFSDSNQTLLIHQEKLVLQPHSEVARLATYLEGEVTATEIELLFKDYPLQNEKIEAWQEILNPQQCFLVETLLSSLLLHFHNETETNLSPRLDQHLASIQLEPLLIQIDKLLAQIFRFKSEELREQFYESIDKHLITTLTAIGRLEEAAEVCHLLGKALTLKNNLQSSEKWYLRALSIQPQLAKSYYNLGFVYEQQDEWEKAINNYSHAVTINPNYIKAHYRLGLIFKRQKDFGKAIEQFSQVLQLDPKNQAAKFNLALLWQQGEGADFILTLLDQTELELLPQLTEQINDTGAMLVRQGKWEQAKNCFQFVIELDPDYVLSHYNLAGVLQNQKQYPEAIYSYRRALKIDSNYLDALKNLGYVYYKNGQSDLAQECFHNILQLDPNHADTYELLGFMAGEQGKLTECINLLNEALKINPNNPKLHSCFLFNLSSLISFTPQQILDSAQLWYQQQVVNQWLPNLTTHRNDKTPHRRLRIGYISPDFRRHSVSAFIKPVLQNHDRTQFEVFCYGEVKEPDAVTDEIIDICDGWRSTVGLSDLQVAELIQTDRIDILIDLAGHTANNRMMVLGMKPAPIQATYLGYFATTGLSTIDYWITDQILHPDNTQEKTSESIWRLPRCYVGYEPLKTAPEVTELPFKKKGVFTFGSFNNLRKLTPETFAMWVEILKAVPNSRLMLKCASSDVFSPLIAEKIQTPFVEQGIDAKRIFLYGGYAADEDHLGLYNQVDLHLDSMPYTGCTTTCEALWMGVPTVTLAGTRKMERMSASILHGIGLDDFIAHSTADYVQIAIELAQNPDYLQSLRSNMRERLSHSPLLDVKNMASTLEAAYRQMWQVYLEKETAESNSENAHINVDLPVDLEADEAINYYQQYLESHPDDAQAYYYLGQTYQKLDDVENAISSYLQSLAINRCSAATYQALGKLLEEQELIDQAEKYYRCALLVEPDNSEIRENLKVFLQQYCSKPANKVTPIFQKNGNNSEEIKYFKFIDADHLEPDECLVEIEGEVKVCVKNDINSLTGYVLLEQGDWFEPEMEFVRKLITPGMQILDIGANHGVYTLTMAKLLQGQGKITAYEPASSVVSLLRKGVEANDFNNVELVNAGLSDCEGEAILFLSSNSELNSLKQDGLSQEKETIKLLNLDRELEQHNWQQIDFIKLDAEGEEAKILAGGKKFFSEQSPLIMFELKHGKHINMRLIQLFQDLNYEIYYLVSGLGCLVPFDVNQPVDGYQLNLFACKVERSQQLAERGLLVREIANKPLLTNSSYWLEAISALNYATPFLNQWQEYTTVSHADSQVYLEGLNYFFIAKSVSLSPAQQLAALKHSFECIQQAVQTKASLFRYCSLARVAAELGKRQVSVEILEQLITNINSGRLIKVDEPFIPVSQQYDHQIFNNNLQDWLLVSIIETFDNRRVFSSYFSMKQTVSLLNQIIEKPFHSHQSEGRLLLAKKRLDGELYTLSSV
ncbi:FkbM family methyltransferase [Nodularia spumigena]|uniref:FkbM family methyltransferase n=1 Tax=Nodularia spumigena TaxID=70799 RepID=UPI00232EBB60|nr:FkbM family methyltransferase [Nodularia spumigena]MDB9339432.1 FkbM family methyltransferase [Nodularia spumigena CS-589/07]MDB9357769.1 FkbM family methyltransferase [Nodularia spumigena CS-587/03]MDB9501109.1 FkbM family methyltransferase [Nodularia spumigena CS-336/02]MDB9532107.1 FkbM family methyltransferase [Nodularia spumigena CS-1038]